MNLKWTNTKKALFKKISCDNLKYKCGASCAFIKVGKTWGIKLFYSEKSRDFAYSKQRYVLKKTGLAPNIGDCFSILHPNCSKINPNWSCTIVHKKIYCYITEVAVMRIPSHQRIYELCSSLKKIGISTDDIGMYSGNIGFLRKKLVLIDFDYFSLL